MQPHIRLVEANARDHILLSPPKVLKYLLFYVIEHNQSPFP